MGDALYWLIIISSGLFGGLIAFNNDRQFIRIGFAHFVLYILLSITGAARRCCRSLCIQCWVCRRHSGNGQRQSPFKATT